MSEPTPTAGPSVPSVVREVTILVALLTTACVLALTNNPQLAATALGGALGFALPGLRGAPVPAVVLGLGAGALAGSII